MFARSLLLRRIPLRIRGSAMPVLAPIILAKPLSTPTPTPTPNSPTTAHSFANVSNMDINPAKTGQQLDHSGPDNYGMGLTSGYKLPVWIATDPFDKRPKFPKLDRNISHTDLIVVGAGISGISTAYEACEAGLKVTMIDARDVLGGETGRTSGHLSCSPALGDQYYELIKTFGVDGAKKAFDSHMYALERVGEIAKKEGIECEYRHLPSYVMVEVPDTHPDYAKKNDLPEEHEALKKMGVNHNYDPKGRIGQKYTGAVLEYPKQATFHPTQYLNGVLEVLKKKHADRFQAYTHTRMVSHKDHGNKVTVTTEGQHTIEGKHMAMTTNVPLHIGEIVLKEGFYRTYCVAMKAPKDTFKDVLVYDNGDPYVYVRKTAHPDPKFEYIITGGEDHKVGQETSEGYGKHYENLIQWTKEHYPAVGEAEFKWSGQIVEPNDYLAYTGRNTGLDKNVYVHTADAGNGLTHGLLAGRIITDLITNKPNAWAELYDPARKPKPRTLPEDIKEQLTQNKEYKRYIATDVSSIEEIPKCSGAVMHGGLKKLGKPLAVYKDGEGNATQFSAICPHLHGVVAWNATEMSWDCPIHGSRFDGLTGKCLMGPSNVGLGAENEAAQKAQVGVSG